jgi:hypothetical protein
LGLAEGLEQLLLLGAQILGRFDEKMDMEVAATLVAETGHALPGKLEDVAGLGPGRDVESLAALGNRNLDFLAQSRLDHRNLALMVEIRSFALETLVFGDVKDHVEVASRSAAPAGLALASQAELVAIVDARRHLDAEPLGLGNAALSAAFLAMLLHHLTVALAGIAGGGDREEASRLEQLALAAAMAADDGFLVLGIALAAAELAFFLAWDLDLFLDAAEGLGKLEA